MATFQLSEQSIMALVHYFPKIRKDILTEISNVIDTELWEQRRLPGMPKEHLGLTGLCATISGKILNILRDHYSVKIKQGYFRLDKHPRFSGKICTLPCRARRPLPLGGG